MIFVIFVADIFMKRLIILSGLFISLCAVGARAGDYLNEQEIDRVREAQEIDKRVAVFLRIAERRLNAILGASASQTTTAQKDKKDKKKDKKSEDKDESNDYGPEPTGSTEELLRNYTSVMNELLDKIDDVYEKKKADPKLPSAIDKLYDVGQSHMKRLDQIRSKIDSNSEQTELEKALETVKMAVDGAREFKSK